MKARQAAAALEGRCRQAAATTDQVAVKLMEGDLVLVRFTATPRGKSRKLVPRQQGPYKVLEVQDGVTARLQRVDEPTDVITRHIEHLVPFRGDPEEVTLPDHWEVERILDEREQDRQLTYLVRWRGFGQDADSWVKAEDLAAPQLLKAWRRCRGQLTVDRILRTEKRHGRPYYYVAIEADHGPDDHTWLPATRIANLAELPIPPSRGGVGNA